MVKKINFLVILFFVIQVTFASQNFINRWGFQFLADKVFDTTDDDLSTQKGGSTFNPADIKYGDIIFVRRNSLHEFFTQMHVNIKEPYILLTHVDDPSTPNRYITYINDPRIIVWFGIHAGVSNHPKFIPIPIGINPDKRICWNKPFTHDRLMEIKNRVPKSKMLYMNFSLWTNKPVRTPIKKYFLDKQYCFNQDGKIAFWTYMREMAQYKFVLSPPGNGIDCYRTWEALFAGCIPIVKRSHIDVLHADLPVLIVDDYTQITEDFLKKKYVEFSLKTYNFEKLYMEYWENLIKSFKVKKRSRK